MVGPQARWRSTQSQRRCLLGRPSPRRRTWSRGLRLAEGTVRWRPGEAGSTAGSLISPWPVGFGRRAVLSVAEMLTGVGTVGRPLSFLSFDFGMRRVGVATGNTLLRQAQPLKTVAAEGDARFVAIAKLINEWQPDALVVGVPFHPDGAEHDNTHRARRFARQLNGRFRLPVHEVDERYTTTEALSDGAKDADAAAAAIILNQYFRNLPDDDPAAA